jgi:hypothetical protein
VQTVMQGLSDLALQAVALGLYSIFFSSLCSHRVDSQAGFRGKTVSSNGSVSGDVDVRRLSGIMLLRCMESSPIGDRELVSQEGWVLRADRDLFHTIGQLINHFDRNLAIEVEPRLKDAFLRLLRPNVLYKVLAPVLKRCPTHRVQCGFSPEGGKSMPEVSTSGPCELHLQARRATHFLGVHVPPSGLRQRREIALLSRALTSDEAVVTLVSQCYDAACLRRAIAVTRSRAMD